MTITADELLVLIKARDDATRVFGTVRRNFASFGKDMTRIGRDMSMKVTLPILAIAGAATKMAVTFDEEMTKIITLVGVAESQVNEWRESILALAPAVGVGPAELARAMFVVTSAGAEGAKALGIVEQAAKASAIGLGETAATARAVTAAMQAYASEGLTAARATEILVKTVEKGNLEASALAGTLGKVIGIAAQVGVSFEEVGGFVATFTRLGVSAEESVTSLRGVLKIFLKPTEQMEEALASVNLSSEKLRETLGEIGLAGTLRLLVDRFKDNQEGLAMVIPEVEALAGVLGTAGVQGEAYTKIVEEINTHMGFMEERFQRAKDTPAQQWKDFRAEVAVLAIELGNKLIPTFQIVLRTVSDVIGKFTSMSDKTQTTIIRIAGLVAAIGPLLIVLGSLIKVVGGSYAAIKMLIPVLGGLSGGMAVAAAGVGLIVTEFVKARTAMREWRDAVDETREQTIGVYKEWGEKIRGLQAANKELYDEWSRRVWELREGGMSMLHAWIRVWAEMRREGHEAFQDTTESAEDFQVRVDAMMASIQSAFGDFDMDEVTTGLDEAAIAARVAAKQMDILKEEMRELKYPTEETTEAIVKGYSEAAAAVSRAGSTIEGELVAMMMRTRDVSEAFSRMVDAILEEMIRLTIRQAVMGFLSFLSPAGPVMSVVGLTTAAEGGYAAGGQPFLVGERGPELFVPDKPGTITPTLEPARPTIENFHVHLGFGSRGEENEAVRRIKEVWDRLYS